jgi:predicted glutamine amidotransferase
MELGGVVSDRFFAVGRDLADLRQGQATISKDIELNALKGVIEGQKNTQYLSDKIGDDGEKTRALINDLKFHDLNRSLVERNTELVNCEQDRGRYRDRYWDTRQDQFGAQFAALQNQLQSLNQNFNSQLSETRQGMVNFGTMAGVGQTSSANNVR